MQVTDYKSKDNLTDYRFKLLLIATAHYMSATLRT